MSIRVEPFAIHSVELRKRLSQDSGSQNKLHGRPIATIKNKEDL
jgi:hypothetical protein